MTAGHPSPTSRVDELLAQLGLPPGAPSEDVEAAHEAVVEFLADAPPSIRGWAHAQAAAADEALLLLTSPAASAAPTLSGRSKPVANQPGGPATPPVRRATPTPKPVAPAPASEADQELALLATVTPSLHRDEMADGPRHGAGRGNRVPGPIRNLAIVAALAVGAVTIGAVVYDMGGTDGAATAGATQAPAAANPSAPALDQAAVADLMARVQANPNDTATLILLADEFYAVGQWSSAKTWLDKVLALEPDNIRGLLASGATSFNLGDLDAAEAAWLRVVELDEDNLEAHYDLGFLYLNADPADLDGVAREWGRVMEIDPDSELAKIVSTHLTALMPSAAPSGAPSADPSAAPSADPSPAPSADASAMPSEVPSP
jgi:tetratricopeptide (TPR) repeat protein